MAKHLQPSRAAATFTPRETVAELDRFIIGQRNAKRAVAVALRNRWRRQQVPDELREEIAPKNIIMVGPTGVGKTEIARRLARLAQAPFIKVEASKYTEVGYVGRDVESMIRDLVELAIQIVQREEEEAVRVRAREAAEERLLDLLLPTHRAVARAGARATEGEEADEHLRSANETREKIRTRLREGKLDEKTVEFESEDRAFPTVEVFSPSGGMEEMGINFKDMLGQMLPGRSKTRKVKVPEARAILEKQEAERLIDMEKVVQEAVTRTEQSGIVFLDELDKVAGREYAHGPDVSREGVQRDLLPIIEGSTVSTKHGPVKTDHVLFIAAGAFHVSKVSDLIPEIQGRFPIRVELNSLTEEDFVRILVEPQNCLVRQYVAMLETEGLKLEFTQDAIREVARLAASVNMKAENIGARRLHTVMEKLLDDISFRAPEMDRSVPVEVDGTLVRERLEELLKDEDLSRFIL